MKRFILIGLLVCMGSIAQAMVQNVLLTDFEGGTLPTHGKVTNTNSSASSDSGSATAIVDETGSKRLQITDSNGGVNGAYATFSTAFSEPGFYLITADVKVQNSSSFPINTYGMAAKVDGTGTAKINDVYAGYVLNLSDGTNMTNGAALGYQTIGAGVIVPEGGMFPKALTLYFSTDPSSAPSHTGRGDFTGSHRGSAASWAAGTNTNKVFVDNIRKIGPGSRGEERHAWISISDGLGSVSTLESRILQAKANGFNCIDLLVRYRANRYYLANRDFNSYTNNEPAASGVSSSNDPLQYAIDRCRQLDMKVFATISCFLATDGSNNYPSVLPSGSVTYMYNNGNPIPQTTADDGSGLWMDVGREDVRRHVLNATLDIVQNYDVDGIIFDRIRSQGTSFGYNPVALSEMGYSSPPAPTDAAFIKKRQETVAKFLHDAYEEITTLKPWVVVGTVPIAYGTSFQDTYNRVFQSFPMWSKQISANRNISFGSQDNMQPQFYRQWDSGGSNNAPLANQTLMNLGAYGAISSDAMDYGLMPGSNLIYSPLFYVLTPLSDETDAAKTASAIATNICDTRSLTNYFCNGFGVYSAKGMFDASQAFGTVMMSRIRAVSTSCGTDVMSGTPAFPDYLMKKGYDNTPPNPVTGLTATGGYFAQLNWTAPAAAADGESASWYEIYRSTNSTVDLTYANRVGRKIKITGTGYRDEQIPGAGNFYYVVVAVDDYNNRSTPVKVGPVSLQTGNFVVESRTTSGGVTGTGSYVESGGVFGNTSAKSTASYLTGSGARYGTTIGQKAKFIPNLPLNGDYNIYVTMLGGGSNGFANAVSNYVVTHNGGTQTGTVNLVNTNSALNSQWLLLKSSVNFKAGTSGSIEFTFSSLGSGSGDRFVSDAVRFEFVSSSVEDWSLYD